MKIVQRFFPTGYSFNSWEAAQRAAKVSGRFVPDDPGMGFRWSGDGVMVIPPDLARPGMEAREWRVTIEFETTAELRDRVEDGIISATEEQLAAIAKVLEG